MIVLGLDTATRTGWAWGEPGRTPEFGSFVLPKTGTDIGEFLWQFWRELHDVVKAAQPHMVGFEAPLFLLQSKSNANTARKLMGLTSLVEFYCKAKGIRVAECDTQSVKKHFTGRGRFTKKAKRDEVYPVIAECHARGWMVENDDQADAVAIWSYTCYHVDPDASRRHDPLARAAGGW